ncbi:thioredoxin family protein [Acinetobacter nematophilus]|uniref:Thioredoxin family protein n=1 Tax=Acinetobacter nematophilus TaxID=2994642 RepID=A0A9X3DUW4_9GAMM|nr:thioredoxin family protein [Acinetobacter nematophilus]MCX5468823.1 thioredoxin family protein [Acinetobacter nematophilus]
MKIWIATVFILLSNTTFANVIKWNEDKINWWSYEKGLQIAEQEKKPILLVFYANWCGASKRYGKVFYDQEVVDLSKKFIMIKVNVNEEEELSLEYGVRYIPMTLFLDSQSNIQTDMRSSSSEHPFNLNEENPKELLRLMKKVQYKLNEIPSKPKVILMND